MKLNQIEKDQMAVVVEIDLSNQIKRRLLAIGLYVGAKISLVIKAPLKDPMLFLIRGNLVAFRDDLAKKITVLYV